ncbi:unnamed protein product [Lathyrus oleraceus]
MEFLPPDSNLRS